jgi:hypothetical protein
MGQFCGSPNTEPRNRRTRYTQVLELVLVDLMAYKWDQIKVTKSTMPFLDILCWYLALAAGMMHAWLATEVGFGRAWAA